MKFLRIHLQTKFSAAVITVVLFFGSVNIYLIYQGVSTALKKELQKRLIYIAKNLANNCATPILYEDIITLQKMVDEVLVLDRDIGYCFILDQNNKIIVHSFADGFPKELIAANILGANDSLQIKLLSSGDEVYRDIAIPILSGELGIVRVGVRQHQIQSQIQRVVITFVAMVVLFLILGILGAVIIARFITKPISNIVEVAERLDLEAHPVRIKPTSRDEIGYLTVKFNQMIQRLHRLYHQLKDSQQKLIQTEKMAALGVMAAGIAHEINNPLAGLQNAIRRILASPSNQEQLHRYQPMIQSALNHIAEVVNNLLGFAHPLEDVVEPVDLEDLIEKALLLVAYRLEKNRITLKKEIMGKIPAIWGNPQKLQQVFINLILNAIDTMPDGGTLTIAYQENNGEVRLRISDTGEGIPDEYQSRIFDPFFTTKPAGKGTGLGLSVSYQIIRSHGGRLTFSSTQGKGTTFCICLPVKNVKEKEVSPAC